MHGRRRRRNKARVSARYMADKILFSFDSFTAAACLRKYYISNL